ncbi:MAG TPA: hypothetical protein VMS86_00720 [Thermoanaerobaculia bacterium]|nr:hypothetical protein [Thermoanaerobaculia bacterium]
MDDPLVVRRGEAPGELDGEQIRMVDRRGGPRLLLEATQAVGIPGDVGRQNFTATSRPRRESLAR